MKQRETRKVRDPIKNWLRAGGWRVWRNVIGPFSEMGMCDLMALKDGRIVCIETKSDAGDDGTELQKRFLRDMAAHGAALAVVVSSLDELKALMHDAGLE